MLDTSVHESHTCEDYLEAKQNQRAEYILPTVHGLRSRIMTVCIIQTTSFGFKYLSDGQSLILHMQLSVKPVEFNHSSQVHADKE